MNIVRGDCNDKKHCKKICEYEAKAALYLEKIGSLDRTIRSLKHDASCRATGIVFLVLGLVISLVAHIVR